MRFLNEMFVKVTWTFHPALPCVPQNMLCWIHTVRKWCSALILSALLVRFQSLGSHTRFQLSWLHNHDKCSFQHNQGQHLKKFWKNRKKKLYHITKQNCKNTIWNAVAKVWSGICYVNGRDLSYFSFSSSKKKLTLESFIGLSLDQNT